MVPIYLRLCFIGVLLTSASEISYDYPDYKDHPCDRPCEDGGAARLCEYDFIMEDYYTLTRACYDCPSNSADCFRPHCVAANGVHRDIRTVNRMMPGPSITVCEGDTIKVKVDNRMEVGTGTSIHWHGILQNGTGHMDGVAMLTQCPISSMTTFTYKFKADNAGTHYWHAHIGTQRADGLFGPLVVRRPPKFEPHKDLYDHDLTEHVITVNDWFEKDLRHIILESSHIMIPVFPMTVLINGRSEHPAHNISSNSSEYNIPQTTITVEPNTRYRFRVISAGIFNCPVQFSIDNHTLLMIASDGYSFEPYQVESFMIYTGERFDFVLHTSNTTDGNFWIRTRGEGFCYTNGVPPARGTAILKYKGAPDTLPEGATNWEDNTREGKVLNSLYKMGTEDAVEISRMRSVEPDDDWLTSVPDRKYYIAVDLNIPPHPAYHHELYPLGAVSWDGPLVLPQMNQITFRVPPSPLLSQFKDVPKDLFCNAETVQKQCARELCRCMHLYKVDVNDLVELVVVDESKYTRISHPMHMHGHNFRVVAMGKLGEETTMETVKAMDTRGEINRTTSRAPLKDNAKVPIGGYTVLRFRATNPGVWFFHCHISVHHHPGMAMIFQVGDEDNFPQNPKNFPTCGSFDIDDDDDDDDDDQQNDQQKQCSDSAASFSRGRKEVVLLTGVLCLMVGVLMSRV